MFDIHVAVVQGDEAQLDDAREMHCFLQVY